MCRLFRDLRTDRSGAAILEFTFVLPVLLTILMGMIEMGRMFYVRQALEYATEQAARDYMLNPSKTSGQITTTLRNAMTGGMGASVSVAYSDTANCNGNSAVTCSSITASYTFTTVVSYLNLGNPVLTAKAQAVRVQ